MTQHKIASQPFIAPLQLHTTSVTVDPLVLPPGSTVAVISPDEGVAAHAYAQARPHWSVTGWLPDMKSLLRAQSLHAADNLSFDKQPLSGKSVAQPVNAIIAVGWAHRLYSEEKYHAGALMSGMQSLLAQLPKHGQLLIQDVALPDNAESFISIEIEHPEMAAALQHFSHSARPKASAGMQGFFMEKLPSPHPSLQRFRLTAKWAAEFFQRWRNGISMDAAIELTTLTLEQWAHLVEQCGARAVYRAPHVLNDDDAKDWKTAIRFYDAQENELPLPPASFTLLVEKIEDRDAAAVYERRPSVSPPKNLLIKGAHAPKWIEPAQSCDDILVWRRDAQGRLRLWLQADVPRPIINTVPRGTANLDGRRWAGYLIEPLTLAANPGQPDQEAVAHMLVQTAGISADSIQDVAVGVRYYPAPEYLAQRVRGLFVRVTQELPPMNKHHATEENPGRLIEVLADDVLRALSAGLIADSKLEILIGALMQGQGDKPSRLGEALEDPKYKKPINKMIRPPPARVIGEVKTSAELEKYLISGHAMRSLRSVFVADQVGPTGRHALHVTEDDFIVPESESLSANTAVCVPLIRSPMGRFLLGGEPRKLPVPNRMGDSEPMQSLPSFRLPEHVTTLDEARKFLGQQLGIGIDDITSFGPSFFLQPHFSPERVYPFLIHAPVNAFRWDRLVKPQGRLNVYYDRPVEKSRAWIELKTRRDMGEWYMGLTPDITADITARVQTDAPPVMEEPQNDNQITLKPTLG